MVAKRRIMEKKTKRKWYVDFIEISSCDKKIATIYIDCYRENSHHIFQAPGALRFNVLRIIADQFYYNVHDVRTKDDTLLNVKLMIFFELKVIFDMI